MTTNTIPEVIQKTANGLVGDYLDLSDSRNAQLARLVAQVIHDAVMAERERCARIADDEATGRDWQRADANAQNDKRAARDFETMKIEAVQIASAIRATPKAEG